MGLPRPRDPVMARTGRIVMRSLVAKTKGVTADTPVAQRVKSLKGMKVGVLDLGGGLIYQLNAVLGAYGKKHPDVVAKVQKALQRATDFVHEDPDGAAAIEHKELAQVSIEVFRDAIGKVTGYPTTTNLTTDQFSATQRFNKSSGQETGSVTMAQTVLPEPPVVSVNQAVTGLRRTSGPLASLAPVVDAHAHVFLRGLPLAPVRRYVPDYDATDDDYADVLTANGFRYGVLVQPSFLGTNNNYLMQAMRKRPDRFRGVAVLDPQGDPGKWEHMHAAGVVGIRLNLQGLDIPDLTDGRWSSLLAWLREHDWHVEVCLPAVDLPKLVDPLLGAGVRVVVDHFGTPDPRIGPDDAGFRYLLGTASSQRVWVKTSAAYRVRDTECPQLLDEMFERLINAFGPGRLVWGSDWPHTNHERDVTFASARADLAWLVADESKRRQIESTTALELFHFPTNEQEQA